MPQYGGQSSMDDSMGPQTLIVLTNPFPPQQQQTVVGDPIPSQGGTLVNPSQGGSTLNGIIYMSDSDVYI